MITRLALLSILAGLAASVHASYESHYESGAANCQKIDPDEYQSGLFMNPSGSQSYYLRSACFQRLAVKLRAIEFCDEVRRRWALFSTSGNYSKGRCRELVKAGLADDSEELLSLRRRYEANPRRLLDLKISKNGNGRDYDLVPTFSRDGFSYGYTIAVYLLKPSGQRVLIDENGFNLRGGERIRMFARSRDITRRWRGFRPGETYDVEVTMTLSVGHGPPQRMRSEAFMESVFPTGSRQQVLKTRATF